MTKATLRKLVIIASSVAALSAGLGIDAAYARGGGGFGGGHGGGGFGGGHMGGGLGGGHMGRGFGGGHIRGGFGGGHMSGGFGGGHTGGIGGGHIGGEFGGGHLGGVGMATMGGSPIGTERFGAPTENHVGALAGVHFHPGATDFGSRHHHRWRGDYASSLLCEDDIMVDPACGQPH
jgi:hypothetical protein